MTENGAALPTVDADLCIVGAGPAGITLARELDGTGMRIVLLESGDRDPDRAHQRAARGESTGHSLHLLHHSRRRAFGGTLRHPEIFEDGWACRPLDPIDFEARPGRPHSGWPFDRAHLEPYYARAHAGAGIAGHDYDPAAWSDRETSPLLPLDGSGVHSTVFRFGTGEFDEAYRALEASSDVRVLLRSQVVGLHATDGRVEGVEVRHDDGARFTVRPRTVVLATGGIENARLLLANRLGNEHDLVGRFFSERLSTHAGHVVDERDDLVASASFYTKHPFRGSTVFGALRLDDVVAREHELANCVFWMVPRPSSVTTDAVRSLATLRKLAGRSPAHPRTREYLGHVAFGAADLGDFFTSRVRDVPEVITVRAQGEQEPNPRSRVTLGDALDDHGVPVARVHWQVEERDRAAIDAAMTLVGKALTAAGHGRIRGIIGPDDPEPLWEGNHHHMGTTRMHDDPRRGVVDATSRVHSVANLYVTGSSVFPTYGASNPTLTVLALAHRLADHLRTELGAP